MGEPMPALHWSGADYAHHSAHHRAVDDRFLARIVPGLPMLWLILVAVAANSALDWRRWFRKVA